MRIAIVAGAFPVLSETFVLNQITGLLDRGHDVRVFADHAGDSDVVHPDVESYGLLERTHYWSEGRRYRKLLDPRRTLRAAAEGSTREAALEPVGEFDAILCHFGHVGERVRRLRKLGVIDGPLAVIFHAWDLTVLFNEKERSFYDSLFEEAEMLLPISEKWRGRLIELGADPRRIEVHHMGIDTRRFECRLRSRGEEEPTRFVMVARLVEKKGVEYAIRALAAVRRRYGVDARMEILGDGPLRDPLGEIVRGLEVGDAVQFLGWCDQDVVAERLRAAHVLCAPSVTAENGDMEGIPVGIMEAMASGMPVVSTWHSGIGELVEDGVTGYLVPERDVGALAEAMREVAENPGSWIRLGTRARAKVEREFDIRPLNQRLELLLKGLAVNP
jgi:colanic acid/amylovoran biosynthesis glycosyltransferase